MKKSGYWADNYQQNGLSVEKTIGKIQSGQRIFVGSLCGEVQYVVTEYGSVNLFGKSLQERALAMISSAHRWLSADRSCHCRQACKPA